MTFRKTYAIAENILWLLARQRQRFGSSIIEKEWIYEEVAIMQRLQHANLLQALLKDLLQSGLYDLNGLARELAISIEHLTDLLLQKPCDPSYSLALNILYLHRETFPKLYEEEQIREETTME